MYLVQILLPRADNDGRVFPRTEYDRLKEELADRYDGVTAYLQNPAEGLWREGGRTDHDQIVIVEVMIEKLDPGEWRSRRSDLERRFRQEMVIIRYSPVNLV